MRQKYFLLNFAIKQKFGNYAEFGKAVGMSKIQVSNRMTGRVKFVKSVIETWAEVLEIQQEDIWNYFEPVEFN